MFFTNWGHGWAPFSPADDLKPKKKKIRRSSYLDHGTRHTSRDNDPDYDRRKYGHQAPVMGELHRLLI